MVKKTKSKKTSAKKVNNKVNRRVQEDDNESLDVDDALAGLDEGDVQSAKSKIKAIKKSKKDLDEELDDIENEISGLSNTMNGKDEQGPVTIKASKPIFKIKKGDKITIDGELYEVDSHYVLIDHGSTKEMTIEIFDKADRDYQLRYFNDRAESTLQLYQLQEIVYVKKPMQSVSW